jgi:ribosomal-protein-alanine N-acetyltransferase
MTPAMLQAELSQDEGLCGLLRAKLTNEWPPRDWEEHVVRMILAQSVEQPETTGWHRYVILAKGLSDATLIGCVGGFPKPEGAVEIGYSILPEFQRRGFATEAVGALVHWLMRDEQVLSITAQAAIDKQESIKVMQRCGLQYAGAGDEPNTVRYALARS